MSVSTAVATLGARARARKRRGRVGGLGEADASRFTKSLHVQFITAIDFAKGVVAQT